MLPAARFVREACVLPVGDDAEGTREREQPAASAPSSGECVVVSAFGGAYDRALTRVRSALRTAGCRLQLAVADGALRAHVWSWRQRQLVPLALDAAASAPVPRRARNVPELVAALGAAAALQAPSPSSSSEATRALFAACGGAVAKRAHGISELCEQVSDARATAARCCAELESLLRQPSVSTRLADALRRAAAEAGVDADGDGAFAEATLQSVKSLRDAPLQQQIARALCARVLRTRVVVAAAVLRGDHAAGHQQIDPRLAIGVLGDSAIGDADTDFVGGVVASLATQQQHAARDAFRQAVAELFVIPV